MSVFRRTMQCLLCGDWHEVMDKDTRRSGRRPGGWYCCEECER